MNRFDLANSGPFVSVGAFGDRVGADADLRRTTAERHATINSIVLGGAHRSHGMPSFAKGLASPQVRMIQADILDQVRREARAATGLR